MSIPFINNPTITPSGTSNLWNEAGTRRTIPLGNVSTTQWNFKSSLGVAAAVVYIECVVDDVGDSKTNVGQYNVGDRIACPMLGVTIIGSSVKVSNPNGAAIILIKSDSGSPPQEMKKNYVRGTFIINTDNAYKYRLLCFVNLSKQPAIPA